MKGGAGGVEGTVKHGDASITGGGGSSGGKVEGKVGPVTAGGAFTKDSAKLDLKIAAGPVEFKGNIAAKAGQGRRGQPSSRSRSPAAPTRCPTRRR